MTHNRWLLTLVILGVGLGLVWGLVSWLAPAPGTATLELTVVDAVTNAPVTATITLRRETPAGAPLGAAENYVGTQLTFGTLADGNVLQVLVVAPGYADWGVALRVSKPGHLGGPVRLKRLPAIDD